MAWAALIGLALAVAAAVTAFRMLSGGRARHSRT
jgi:hypothetical protein